MPRLDLSPEDLKVYAPSRTEPPDFDSFWSETMLDTNRAATAPTLHRVENGLETLETFDVTFSGFGGHQVKAWLHLPVRREAAVPCVVQYIGYGGGRGFPHQWTLWASAGYAHLVMDTRGQGTGFSHGHTEDPVGSPPSASGFLTRGISDPTTYYYRRVYVDAAQALAVAASLSQVDTRRIALVGTSQGGGLALAVAGLSGMQLAPEVAAVSADVPFLCHFRRAVDMCDTEPYVEISRYLAAHRDQVSNVFHTLSYFDAINFAARAKAPALFSAAHMDTVCPPSTVYAAYNACQGSKQMLDYPFNGHEGGGAFHEAAALRWVRELLK